MSSCFRVTMHFHHCCAIRRRQVASADPWVQDVVCCKPLMVAESSSCGCSAACLGPLRRWLLGYPVVYLVTANTVDMAAAALSAADAVLVQLRADCLVRLAMQGHAYRPMCQRQHSPP